ncbi:MAG: ABC transporter permease [bacterium]
MMLRSYIKLAWRNLRRNRLSSIINITGLSVAIGCSIVFFLLLDREITTDRFHKNAENIFLIGYTLEGDQSQRRWGDSPQPLGPALEAEFPQVKRAVRVAGRNATIRYDNKVFRETIRFADPAFLEMFSFPLKAGDRTALADENALVLSEAMAVKYFGDENPIGRELVVTLDKAHKQAFVVKGVAKRFPVHASFSFNILASFEKLQNAGLIEADDWASLLRATFIEVNNPEDLATIAPRMQAYVDRQNAAQVDRPIASFIFEPLPTLSWESQEIRRSISSGSTPEILIMLFVIAIFLLLQACFGYVNISLAAASTRFKEIGIRKVAGSKRSQLVKQFLGENLLLCSIALIAGLMLAEYFFLPGLFKITGARQSFSLIDFFSNMHLWLFFAVLLLITAAGAGAYPALYISSLKPATALKGKLKIKGKNKFTSSLLSFQFTIAFIIVCLVVAFWQNNRYQRERDWGYNQEHVLNVRVERGEQFEVFKNAVTRNPDILSTAGSVHHVGRTEQQAVIEVAAKKYEVLLFDVGPNYLETLGIRLETGRFFDPELTSDLDAAIVVNRQFVNEISWQKPLEKTIRFDNKMYKVVGVTDDFHYDDFFEEIRPLFFRLAPEESFNYLSVRVRAGTSVRSAEKLERTWRNLFPDAPYHAFFQDSVFENAFRNNASAMNIFGALAVITLVISCMGLFGLVGLVTSKRMKELSIHKVLGASMRQIAQLISKRFVKLIVGAMLWAIPGSYIFLTQLFDGMYRYHITLGAVPFLFAGAVVVLTALATFASQVYKAAVSNPVDVLRSE